MCTFLFALLFNIGIAFCQEKDTSKNVNINITSKTIIHFKTDSGEFNKFIGEAVFIQETDTLFCDSLYQNSTTKNIEAFGDVKVHQQGGTKAESNYLRYISAKKLAYMRDKVSLTDGKNKLFCNELNYDLTTKTGIYNNGGKLVTDSTTVTSTEGEYKVNDKIARFKKQVVVTDVRYHITSNDMSYRTDTKLVTFYSPSVVTSDSGKNKLITSNGTYDSKTGTAHFIGHSSVYNDDHYLEGDSIFYDKPTGYGYAYGNVISIDTTHHSKLYCQHLEYYKFKRIMWAMGKPVLEQVNGKDTLYLRADTFYSYPAANGGKIFKKPKTPTQLYIDSLTTIKDSLQINTDSINKYTKIILKNYDSMKLQFSCKSLEFEVLTTHFKPFYKPVDSLKLPDDSAYLSVFKILKPFTPYFDTTDKFAYSAYLEKRETNNIQQILFKLYYCVDSLKPIIDSFNQKIADNKILINLFTHYIDSINNPIDTATLLASNPYRFTQITTLLYPQINNIDSDINILTLISKYGEISGTNMPSNDTMSIKVMLPDYIILSNRLNSTFISPNDSLIKYLLPNSGMQVLAYGTTLTKIPFIETNTEKLQNKDIDENSTNSNLLILAPVKEPENTISISESYPNLKGVAIVSLLLPETETKAVYFIMTDDEFDTTKYENISLYIKDTATHFTTIYIDSAKQNNIDDSSLLVAKINDNGSKINNKTQKPDKIKTSKKDKIAISKPKNDTAVADSTSPLIFIGYHNAKIFSDSLQGTCDSISYSQADSTIRMIYDPIAWSHLSQITGDTIFLKLDGNGKLKSMFVPNNSFVVSQSGPERAKLFDQVQGKTLTGFFVNNAITKLIVTPNAESIYYSKDSKGAYVGESEAKSEKMRIFFENQEVKMIVFEKNVIQTMTPLEMVDIPAAKLSRFKWLIDQRPKSKKELFE